MQTPNVNVTVSNGARISGELRARLDRPAEAEIVIDAALLALEAAGAHAISEGYGEAGLPRYRVSYEAKAAPGGTAGGWLKIEGDDAVLTYTVEKVPSSGEVYGEASDTLKSVGEAMATAAAQTKPMFDAIRRIIEAERAAWKAAIAGSAEATRRIIASGETAAKYERAIGELNQRTAGFEQWISRFDGMHDTLGARLDGLEGAIKVINEAHLAAGEATKRRTNDRITSIAASFAERLDRLEEAAGATQTGWRLDRLEAELDAHSTALANDAADLRVHTARLDDLNERFDAFGDNMIESLTDRFGEPLKRLTTEAASLHGAWLKHGEKLTEIDGYLNVHREELTALQSSLAAASALGDAHTRKLEEHDGEIASLIENATSTLRRVIDLDNSALQADICRRLDRLEMRPCEDPAPEPAEAEDRIDPLPDPLTEEERQHTVELLRGALAGIGNGGITNDAASKIKAALSMLGEAGTA